ncbi:MAG: FkbM family methyltransferase [Beijerinckiaceae bacterium]
MHPRFVQAARFFGAIARSFPGNIKDTLFTAAKSINFANYGEDLLLTRMFRLPERGFYVDVGGNHPIVASNTFRLDLMGWEGVAIEPNPDLVRRYARLRPHCRVVQNAVGDDDGTLEFITFNLDQCNTFDPALADKARSRGAIETGRQPVKVRKLGDILAETAGDRLIDVMSIDIEGFEMAAFRSNDWARWTPAIILAEDHVPTGEDFTQSELARYLNTRGYWLVSRVHFTSFFVHRDHAARLEW